MSIDGLTNLERFIAWAFWLVPVVAWIIHSGRLRGRIHWFKFLAGVTVLELAMLIVATEVSLVRDRQLLTMLERKMPDGAIWQMRSILYVFAVLYAIVWPAFVFAFLGAVEAAVRWLRVKREPGESKPNEANVPAG